MVRMMRMSVGPCIGLRRHAVQDVDMSGSHVLMRYLSHLFLHASLTHFLTSSVDLYGPPTSARTTSRYPASLARSISRTNLSWSLPQSIATSAIDRFVSTMTLLPSVA